MATTHNSTEKTKEAVVMPEKEKMLTVILPIDRNEVDDGVSVWVNHKRYVIKRGVPVKVPESVALILKAQEEMLQISYAYEAEAASKAEPN